MEIDIVHNYHINIINRLPNKLVKITFKYVVSSQLLTSLFPTYAALGVTSKTKSAKVKLPKLHLRQVLQIKLDDLSI